MRECEDVSARSRSLNTHHERVMSDFITKGARRGQVTPIAIVEPVDVSDMPEHDVWDAPHRRIERYAFRITRADGQRAIGLRIDAHLANHLATSGDERGTARGLARDQGTRMLIEDAAKRGESV
jgi:hypothetical protein